jgi:gamma-D-glutamyl-L-lysine dipeptidyl-peptidase
LKIRNVYLHGKILNPVMKINGIIIQSVVPLRKEPTHKAEMVSQVLFGEPVVVEQQVMDWYRIRIEFDGTTGWLERFALQTPEKQPHPHPDWILTASAETFPLGNDSFRLRLHPGTVLREWDREKQTYTMPGKEWYLNNREVIRLPEIPDRKLLVNMAYRFIGIPYLWGGNSIAGIDATGLIQTLFKITGLALSRNLYELIESGSEVHFSHEAIPGDIAFFSLNDNDNISHAGIVMENNQVLHAFGRVRLDNLDSQGIFNQETGNYSHALRILKRLIKDA